MRKIEKLKKFMNENKVAVISSVSGMSLAAMQVTAHAAEVSSDISGVITSSFQTIVTQTIQMVSGVAPIGITIFGAFFCWKKGIKFFKNVTSS